MTTESFLSAGHSAVARNKLRATRATLAGYTLNCDRHTSWFTREGLLAKVKSNNT